MRLFRLALVALLGSGSLVSCSTGTTHRDITPPDAPTQQSYEPVTGGAISVRWRNPRDSDFDATLLARIVVGTDKPHSTSPSSQSKPREGDPFGGSTTFGPGKVLYVGKAATFLDVETPDKCTAFVYQLYSRDTAGNWSVGAAQVDVDPGATSTAPTKAVSGLTAAAVDGDVQLAWTNPEASTGFVEVRVVRKEGAAPASPTDGVAIFSGKGSATAEPLASLGFGAWTYGVFSCNGCGVCNDVPSTIVFNRAAPADGGMDGGPGGGGGNDGGMGPLTPTQLSIQLSGDGKNVLLSWTSPADVTDVKVLRTLNASAIGPGDASATVVFQGAGTSASERTEKLTPETAGSPALFHYRVYGCRNGSCESTGIEKTLSLTLAQALKGGGYTLFWRHATANVCGDQTQLGPASNTTQPDWWKSCDKNCLTAYARQIDGVQAPNETATIHAAFLARGFTVGKVLTSEFCRAVETAQRLDFGPPIEQSQVLTYYVYDEGQRCPNTMALLNTPPASGTNTAMISHAGFTCPIIDSLAWGEAAIYRPVVNGAPRFVGRVPWNGWTLLP